MFETLLIFVSVVVVVTCMTSVLYWFIGWDGDKRHVPRPIIGTPTLTTPCQWKITSDGRIIAANGKTIAIIGDPRFELVDVDYNNAKLLVAAPELLFAAEASLIVLNAVVTEAASNGSKIPVIEAIAKCLDNAINKTK